MCQSSVRNNEIADFDLVFCMIGRACCGDGFSIFSSSNGIVMTCGDAASGCLGQGDDQSLSKPKLIEALLHVDVASIACGDHHVAIVGTKGEVYTWGDGTQGKLGLGNEDSHILPQEVPFSEPVNVREVFCGEDGTMFLTDEGIAWACGSNKNNKLGLNNRQGFIAALKHAFNPVCVIAESPFSHLCELFSIKMYGKINCLYVLCFLTPVSDLKYI